MDRRSTTNEGEGECMHSFDGKARRDHQEIFHIGWRIILNWLLEK
jgi:hypothetical protein